MPVENTKSGSSLNLLQRTALLLVIAANIVVWGVLVLDATFGQRGSSPAAVPVIVTATFTPAVSVSPPPPVAPHPLLADDGATIPITTTTLSLPVLDRDAASLLAIGDDTIVIALLGVDKRSASSIWRSDSIILAFIAQKARRMDLLSIPRDLWVYIPDHGEGRINTVDALGERAHGSGGGQALLDRTLRHNLGVPVDHVVRIDFDGFVRIIDAVGGVTVEVEKPIADVFPDPHSPTGEFRMDLPAGPQHLDGRTALAYCRSRLSTNDFDRARRQRQVLMALWKQTFTTDTLAHAPQLWDTLGDAFETDLSMGEIMQLAQWAYGIGPENVHTASLDATMVRSWTTPQGAQVLLPQRDAIQRAILDLLDAPD
jgi:LCP family protein required for cell wall assembly